MSWLLFAKIMSSIAAWAVAATVVGTSVILIRKGSRGFGLFFGAMGCLYLALAAWIMVALWGAA